ncbi:MAG: hypothetical protein IKT40_01305 [Bacilli bacterium]|nr:hypothetical protein [Bacilli bacterium]
MKFLEFSLNKCFKHCYLPSEKVLREKFIEHFNCKVEILEQDNEHLNIKLLMEDIQPIYCFVLSNSIDNKPIIVNIGLIES